MDKTELFSFVKSDSIKNLIKASEVKTKEDIERLQADNYLIGFTYDELKNVFTEEIADKLYYNNGFNKTFYYDKDKFVLFSVQLYGKQAVLPFDKMTESISKTAEMLEENIENGDYVHSLMVLNDKMRMEMLNLLVENGKAENGYTLFKNFYQTSDYGCSEITTDTMRKLCSMKTKEQTAETEKNLSEFPDKVTVYRGEGDRSSKWQNAISWTTNINDKLVSGVEKRLVADAKIGFLLSGGLDSSLVCAIAAKKSSQPIKTFAIGMNNDAIDLKYAKEVAEYIGSDHKEIIISKEDVLSSLETVVRLLGTFDITTIRASMGMYLICKAIHEQTDIRVLLTGEISDELFGYKYTDFAPSAEEFQKESEKRIRELHM